MKKVTIQVEARVKFLRTIEMPEDEALAFLKASDDDIICNIDEAHIDDIVDYEVVDIHLEK